jgi:hypothetical protein
VYLCSRRGNKEGRIGDFLFLISKRRDRQAFLFPANPTDEKINFYFESLIGKHTTAPQSGVALSAEDSPERPFVSVSYLHVAYSYIDWHQNREEQLL